MKIWVIGRGYPTPANKMWGSFELEQAKMLARNGYEVSYIALTLSFFNRKTPRGLKTFKEDNVVIHTYSHFYFPGKIGIYLKHFEDTCWRKLFERAEDKSGKPDIIHIHYPSMISSINEIEKYRKQGVRLFVTEHWSRVLIDNLKKHELARLQYYSSHANCFISVSNILQEAVKKLTRIEVPMKVIPNIVSPCFFKKIEKRKDNRFTFVAIGRLVSLKQFDVIIEQFQKSFIGNKNVELKIVGSGPECRNLKKLAKDCSKIYFMGERSLDRVAEEITNADVLVSYSKYETFAAPVAEAWACGKPVIVSDKSGVASFANEQNSLVVISNSENELSRAMKKIYNNYDKYNSKIISTFAKEHFSDSAIINSLCDIYASY